MNDPLGRLRGVTLFHCLTFLVVITLLSGASYRVVRLGNGQVFQSHWGRTAEALADGALEMALAELEAGGEERNLEAILSTGVASAQIVPGSAENQYGILFQGKVAAEGKVRASRIYRAEAIEAPEGNFQIHGIQRL